MCYIGDVCWFFTQTQNLTLKLPFIRKKPWAGPGSYEGNFPADGWMEIEGEGEMGQGDDSREGKQYWRCNISNIHHIEYEGIYCDSNSSRAATVLSLFCRSISYHNRTAKAKAVGIILSNKTDCFETDRKFEVGPSPPISKETQSTGSNTWQ